jgi:cobalt-zinc-cadmium resistance protein CzcA
MVFTEYNVYKNDLKTMIHSEGEIALPEIEPIKMPLVISNDFSLDNTQLSKHLENEIKFSEAIYHTESWRLFPSFEIGWFTQSLDKAKPFMGWQYGISFPIWLWEPVGKIQNARINRDIAVLQQENTLHHLSARYYQLIREFETAQKHLLYYEKNGLLHSQTIIKTGKMSYDKGQIDLFEFIMLVSNAFEIQEEYLDALNKYNQSVIQINKLLGK